MPAHMQEVAHCSDLMLAALVRPLLQAIELPLMVAQTSAIMEVLHSLLGLVRSPVMVTGEPCPCCIWT